jgi:hypothetical protein
MPSSDSLTRSRIIISLGVLAVGAAAVLYRFDPATVHFYPRCAFHALTGLQCPGCGTTRALHHLLHGDGGGAFRLNAMLFVAIPFGAIATASRRVATNPVTGWAAAGVTVIWWVARNVV